MLKTGGNAGVLCEDVFENMVSMQAVNPSSTCAPHVVAVTAGACKGLTLHQVWLKA
jgi:hypothetical protein